MSERFKPVSRPRTSGCDGAVLDSMTRLWAPFWSAEDAAWEAFRLNAGETAPNDYEGWAPDEGDYDDA